MRGPGYEWFFWLLSAVVSIPRHWGTEGCKAIRAVSKTGSVLDDGDHSADCLWGSSESRNNRHAPVTMEESATLKSGQW